MAVDGTNFRDYSGGVLDECGKELNLAGVLVGVEEGYYRLKLSWGNSWG